MTRNPQARRQYAQLLRMHERVLDRLESVRHELDAPSTRKLLREIRAQTGSAPEASIQELQARVEEAIRTLKLSESALSQQLLHNPEMLEVEGAANLPAHLARFLAERSELPGFHYDVVQDEVRGWVIRWKEYTSQGTVRGYGQFYERPYAWIDE